MSGATSWIGRSLGLSGGVHIWILNAIMWGSTPSTAEPSRHDEQAQSSERSLAGGYLVHAALYCPYLPDSLPVRSCFGDAVDLGSDGPTGCVYERGDADLEEVEIADLAPDAKDAYRQRAMSECRSAAANHSRETSSDRTASERALSCCRHEADRLTGHAPTFVDWRLRELSITSDEATPP